MSTPPYLMIICWCLLCSLFSCTIEEGLAQKTESTIIDSSTAIEKDAKADRYALFWSSGSTWIVDTQLGVLFRSPTLLSQSSTGFLLEYRLTAHTDRMPSSRPFGELYRWVSLDRYLIDGQHVDQLTRHFTVEDVKTETHDEHQIIQFTGEYITLVRWFYHKNDDTREEGTSVYSLALDGVEPLPQMSHADKLFDFTKRLYPKLIPDCLTPESRLVHWELSGQRSVYWLMLTPQYQQPRCSMGLSALRVNPPQKPLSTPTLNWRGQTLYFKGESLYGGVVDALIHPSGKVALTLEGPPRDDENLFIKGVPLLYEKPSHRYLSFWRAFDDQNSETGRHFSFSDELDIQRLDGARWIPDDHPLIKRLDTHFMPVTQRSCYRSLQVKKLDKYQRPRRGPNFGHLCAMETTGRVWEGHADLSASLIAQVVDETLYIDLWVNDPDRHPRDQVKLWVGSQVNPIGITLTPKGVIGREAIKAGVKLNWWERDTKKIKHQAESTPQSLKVKGYQVHLQLPLSLTQGSLSLSIDDVDHTLRDAHQRLWLIGRPPAEIINDDQQRVIPERFLVP